MDSPRKTGVGRPAPTHFTFSSNDVQSSVLSRLWRVGLRKPIKPLGKTSIKTLKATFYNSKPLTPKQLPVKDKCLSPNSAHLHCTSSKTFLPIEQKGRSGDPSVAPQWSDSAFRRGIRTMWDSPSTPPTPVVSPCTSDDFSTSTSTSEHESPAETGRTKGICRSQGLQKSQMSSQSSGECGRSDELRSPSPQPGWRYRIISPPPPPASVPVPVSLPGEGLKQPVQQGKRTRWVWRKRDHVPKVNPFDSNTGPTEALLL